MFYKIYFWTIEMSWIRGPICGPIRGRIRGPIRGYLHSGFLISRSVDVLDLKVNVSVLKNKGITLANIQTI